MSKPMFRTMAAAAIVGAAALIGAPGAGARPARADAAASAPQAAPRERPAPRAASAPPATGTVPSRTAAGDAAAPAHQPAAPPPSAQRTPLPDVAIVSRAGAETRTVQATPQEGTWLLVHVKRGSAPCEALLGRMKGEKWADVPARLVIVVAGSTADEVAEMAKRFPALDAAAWFADQPGALASALKMQEMPVILGMKQRGVQWTLAGVLSGSTRMEQVLTGWIGRSIEAAPDASPR